MALGKNADRITIFWFRRDLRLEDNAALHRALSERRSVQCLFIFDDGILAPLGRDDARVTFIHDEVLSLREALRARGAELWIRRGKPEEVWTALLKENDVEAVYSARDGEPAARRRDEAVAGLVRARGGEWVGVKDQSLFERDEILTGTGTPYTVYTPYKNKVLAALTESQLKAVDPLSLGARFRRAAKTAAPSLKELGFTRSQLAVPPRRPSAAAIKSYGKTRDDLGLENGTTHLGPHLRFGTVSVRELARLGRTHSPVYLSELIWRDFFMQVLWHFPHVETASFRREFDQVAWRASKSDFRRWCEGTTGYPLVDAGMRQLNRTGFMHNRARMVTAQFLTKHLLIHWLEGERYFASRLLDYDLAANNGNWQWAAGTGCDAAPYFRIFNPFTQAKRFDPDELYVRRWIPEYGTADYPAPMVDHDEARGRALAEFTKAARAKKREAK